MVGNDLAERGIALIKAHKASLTKDKEQKQLLLRLVAKHCKHFSLCLTESMFIQQF